MEEKSRNKKSNSLGRLRLRSAQLFISVLLHSLLALFPWQKKSRSLAVHSDPPSPIAVVDASLLPTPPASEPQSSLAIPSALPASDVTAFAPIAVPAEPTTDLIPADPVYETSDGEASPLENRTVDAPTTPEAPYPDIASTDIASTDVVSETLLSSLQQTSSDTSNPTPNLNPTPNNEAQIAADWENLVGHLQSQNDEFESFSLLDIFNFFGEPEQANQFFDKNNQPKLDILSYHLFSEQTPEEVLQTVVMPELTKNSSFDLQPQADFTAGLAYPLLQGDQLRYLIIVKLNERSGSVLILSQSL